ncbi:tetratricopeptide repeat protein [Phyllobacterium salinisoli]|uniref:Tetratricopeptide repeat protein n=1 Tax=Phyllobacterium salinisoli TaxID=1899321 RepID=A0A368K5W4_9HYPH|nr:tetratricopeptide repeat protein [Phyllobacterium salinisoli]RCS23410.1 tetratricopeptide repeat protein [Phyllobacterium salinisoli]
MRRSPIYGSIYGLLFAAMAGVALPAPGAFARTNEGLMPIRTGSFAGAYLAGRVAEGDNDLNAAVAYYRQALAFDPTNQPMKQNLLIALLTDGKFKDALPLAEELKTVPEIERFSRVALAIDAISRKQYRKAGPLLMLSLQSDMDRLSTGLMSAWAIFGEGKTKDAIAAVEKLDGPEWYNLFKTYNAALMADAAGDKSAARNFYQQAIDDRSGGSAAPDTYERIVEAYASFKARNGDKKGAIDLLDQATELLSGRLALREVRAKLDGGEKPKPLVSTPQQGAAEVLYTLGTAINRGGAEAFAKLYLQMSLPLRPNDDATLFQLGDIAAKLQQPEKAIEYYGRVPKNSVYRRDAEMQLGLNLAETGKTDEAIKHLKVLLDQDKTDIRSYLALGGVYAQKKDFRNAAITYDDAVKTIGTPTRDDWAVFYQRGIAYERLKEWDKAEPSFREALKLYPDQPQVLNYLGYSWVDMNANLEEALGMIRKAVELRPQDGYIVDSLGWAYYRLGRYDEAVTELEKAVKLRPEDATINDHLGDAYWRAGRKLEATFQWNHAVASKPEPEELAKIEAKQKHGLPDTDEPAEKRAKAVEPKPDKDG